MKTDDDAAKISQARHTELESHYPVLRYFESEHLPERLRKVALPIQCMAWLMADELPHGAETAAGLRKLLEAKDCFVRGALAAEDHDGR